MQFSLVCFQTISSSIHFSCKVEFQHGRRQIVLFKGSPRLALGQNRNAFLYERLQFPRDREKKNKQKNKKKKKKKKKNNVVLLGHIIIIFDIFSVNVDIVLCNI